MTDRDTRCESSEFVGTFGHRVVVIDDVPNGQ